MLTVDNVETARRERLIRGRDHWWFLGSGGIAKVYPRHLDGSGLLTALAEQNLRAAGVFRAPSVKVYSLTVLSSTDCNLGCGYCFQNTAQDASGGNRPPRIQHSRLTSETTGTILSFAEQRMLEANLSGLSITLFGGEPLLNLKGCRELLIRAADYGMRHAAMVSNGVLLTPLVARELGRHGLRLVQVTFDGAQPDHDRIRVRRSGGGTFEAIMDNVARASAESDLRWDLRVNVSHHNRAGIQALLECLASRLDPARCSLYFAQVGDIGIGYANELRHVDELAAEFASWYRQAIDAGFGIPTPGPEKICQACSYKDGRFGAVVNADGTLYSCWETSGKPGWEVGTVDSGYLTDPESAGRWRTCESHYRYTDGEAARRRFQDRVDAAVLDQLWAAGRLTR